MTQENQRFDLAVIGGGPGGYVAAIRAAQTGAKVAMVEKDRLGGTCLIWGCIPSKTLIRSVQVLQQTRDAERFGIELDVSSIRPNMEKIMARKDAVVNQNVSGIETLFKSYKIPVFKGHGRLVAPNRIVVQNGGPDSQEIEASNVIIATGSQIARLPIPGADLEGVTDSDRILSLKHIPKSIVIIGGGIIGVEWACILAPLGTKVTIIEALPNILTPVDEEIMRRFSGLLKKQGVEVHTGAKVEAIEQNSNAKDESERLTVRYVMDSARQAQPKEGVDQSYKPLPEAASGQEKGPEKSIQAEMVMLAIGRWPYTDNLGLAEIGVAMNRRAIVSNARMETNVKGVYAIGDVTQRIMLAHVASHEGEVAVDNIIGHPRLMNYRVVPNCIYTSPEIASVGPTEQELKASGIPYRVSKFPFTALGRAVTLGDTTGLVKLMVSEERGEILAGHIMGPDATDLIAELVVAINERMTALQLSHAIHAHPTLPEAVQEAALAAVPGASAIHFKKSNL